MLTYVKPLEVIDGLMREHMAYLNRHYAEGTFLVSGRQVPRTGGVIIARGDNLEEIKRLINEDPFVKTGAAVAEITQFNASQASPILKGLL